eukprot:TRINITY_DN13608_c0_g1_i1.p1 TRINITY_DN13608_c0_g1~~TRINITY_DN13608_c0_g1_i1.p1  ORF type:complete len:309 (-),score=50.58 TRINITY_DN13608_c0_g1_i1:54-947(-)
MSGLRLSTQQHSLTGRATERHLTHAKRKLYQFVGKEIDKASECAYTPAINSNPDESSLFLFSLPVDVLLRVMKFVNPLVLASFGGTCKFFYFASQQPDLWVPHNKQILEDLKLRGLDLNHIELGSKQIFSVLYKHYNTLTQVVNLLRSMRESPVAVEKDRKQVEELFYSRLKLKSPWALALNIRVERELSSLQMSPQRKWRLLGNVLGLELTMKDGFYQGECLHFNIHLDDHYPQSIPRVRSLSSTYHPLISPEGEVQLSLLEKEEWASHSYDLKDIILGIENLFLERSFLTNNFTL